MPQAYADKYGVSDHSAAVLGLIINQGNDFSEKLEFVSVHEANDGTTTETPIDVSGLVFESDIFDGSGIVVGHFTITHTSDNWIVERSLQSSVTAEMAVGFYTYHIDTLTQTGDRKTRIVGTLEIAPRNR